MDWTTKANVGDTSNNNHAAFLSFDICTKTCTYLHNTHSSRVNIEIEFCKSELLWSWTSHTHWTGAGIISRGHGVVIGSLFDMGCPNWMLNGIYFITLLVEFLVQIGLELKEKIPDSSLIYVTDHLIQQKDRNKSSVELQDWLICIKRVQTFMILKKTSTST